MKKLSDLCAYQKLGHVDICRLMGNGDIARGKTLLETLGWLMLHARLKHPDFAEGYAHAAGVIRAESDEANREVDAGNEARFLEETADEAVTCLRALNMEYGGQNDLTRLLELERTKAKGWREFNHG